MKNGKRIDAATFVKAWQASKNLDEVAKRLKSTGNVVSSRASTLRKRGVPLKKFENRFSTPKLDIARLAAIAKRYAP